MCDTPKVCSSSNPRARKEHKCCECRGVIRTGEKYHVVTGLWDSWGRYKICPECEALRGMVCAAADNWDDHPAFGDLYADVFESLNPVWVKVYMDTRRARNAPESCKRWMEEREIELDLASEAEKAEDKI